MRDERSKTNKLDEKRKVEKGGDKRANKFTKAKRISERAGSGDERTKHSKDVYLFYTHLYMQAIWRHV